MVKEVKRRAETSGSVREVLRRRGAAEFFAHAASRERGKYREAFFWEVTVTSKVTVTKESKKGKAPTYIAGALLSESS